MDKPTIKKFYELSKLLRIHDINPETNRNNELVQLDIPYRGFCLTDYSSIEDMAKDMFQHIDKYFKAQQKILIENNAAQWIIEHPAFKVFYKKEIAFKKRRKSISTLEYSEFLVRIHKMVEQRFSTGVIKRERGLYFHIREEELGFLNFGFCSSIAYAMARVQLKTTSYCQASEAIAKIKEAVKILEKQTNILNSFSPLFFSEDSIYLENEMRHASKLGSFRKTTQSFARLPKSNNNQQSEAKNFFSAFYGFYVDHHFNGFPIRRSDYPRFSSNAICDLILICNDNIIISEDTANKWQERAIEYHGFFKSMRLPQLRNF